MQVVLTLLVASCLTYCSSTTISTPSVLSGKVVGTVLTSCTHPTFHTPSNNPYPTGHPNGRFWLKEPRVICLSLLSDVLNYCRRVYSDVFVTGVVSDPFKIPSKYLPPYPVDGIPTIKVYLCLGPTSLPTSSNRVHETTSATLVRTTENQPPGHHLPSLIDVHKAYFAQQFRQLFNSTKLNVSHLVQHLVREARGLVRLYPSNPEVARYAASHMLQFAHQRLQTIWMEEERNWSRLEEAQHEDMVEQLRSEDWSSENEFTYVLQEGKPDLNRVQDALTRLLARLANSVTEEIRHLKLIETRQPWALSLESHPTDWTTNITSRYTNLEQVHQVLLKYVRTATMAINTLHSLISKDAAAHPERQHHPFSSYKPALLTSYDKLQTSLFDAQRELNEAKTVLLGNVTTRMHHILRNMNSTLNPAKPTSLDDWLNNKHHAELAFIDLLVAQILGPYAASIGLSSDQLSDDVWQPDSGSVINPGYMLPAFSIVSSEKQSFQHLSLILLGVAVCLCVLILLVIGCVSLVRLLKKTPSSSTGLRSLLSASGHKLQHLMKKSGKQWMRGTPTWKVSRHVVVVAEGDPATKRMCAGAPLLQPESVLTATLNEQSQMDGKIIRGYVNPIGPKSDRR